ncbi:MAG: hypothetical protein ACI8RD_004311 [Bacillariaceae sp.]|jgi:hypothetical protein
MANRYNDSELSKMDMGPFWNEIVDYIKPVIKEKKNNDNNGETDYVKFALYSGHDSTIAPLMASLSPKIWNNTNFPWYASMMIIEVRYELIYEMYFEMLLFVHTHTYTHTNKTACQFIYPPIWDRFTRLLMKV